jgi:hypothetical protein
MIHRISFLFFLTFIFAQENSSSIHQEQLKHFNNIPSPPVEKIHVLTGLDVLLEKSNMSFRGSLLHWLPIIAGLIDLVFLIISDS